MGHAISDITAIVTKYAGINRVTIDVHICNYSLSKIKVNLSLMPVGQHVSNVLCNLTIGPSLSLNQEEIE